MTKFLSSRLKNLNIGISSYTENERVLTVTGGAFISGDLSVVGVTTISGLTYPSTDGSNLQVLATDGNGTLNFQSVSSLSVFNWNNNNIDLGLITDSVVTSDDSGTIVETHTLSYDLGTLVVFGSVYPNQFVLPSFTVSTLPSTNPAGQMLFVTDETGGSIPAFSDGTNWRRLTDRAIVS